MGVAAGLLAAVGVAVVLVGGLGAADLEESRLWGDYMAAYEEMLSRTSTEWAPWHVIPADHKWVMRALVSHVIIDRFLPFDERVLFRVYTSPTDGRSGGGYVSYDTSGALVGVCC